QQAMEATNQLTILARRTRKECPVKETTVDAKAEASVEADADYLFLRLNTCPPFSVRLVRALSETLKDLRNDPRAFICAHRNAGGIPVAKRKNVRAGIVAAIVFYATAIAGIRVSYAIFHRAKPADERVTHHLISYVAPLPQVQRLAPPVQQTSA